MARLFSKTFDSSLERNIGTRKPRKKIFIAFEGINTEPDYFHMLEKQTRDMEDRKIDIFPVDRAREDAGESHPILVRDGMIDYYNNQIKEYYNEDLDSLWIVIDIDKHFKPKDDKTAKEIYTEYLSTLETKDKVKIDVAITNPSFELWLMLHYKTAEDIDANFDLNEIKKNKKISKNNSYIKSKLNIIRSEDKTRKSIDNYYNHIEDAIKNSSSSLLKKTNNDLFESVGTTVSDLLKIIINK